VVTAVARELSTPGQLLSPEGAETAGQIGMRALGVISPTEEQKRQQDRARRRDEEAARRRAQHQEQRR
jgi:hypothetical protein